MWRGGAENTHEALNNADHLILILSARLFTFFVTAVQSELPREGTRYGPKHPRSSAEVERDPFSHVKFGFV